MKVLGLVLASLALIPASAAASSVAQVAFDDMVRASELIFEGSVIDKRSEMDARGMIYTYVTFQVQDVLKGKTADSQIVLRYQGGRVGNETLHVSDVVTPNLGEKGIYFVESVNRRLVHPLYGWDQGHFLVMASQTDRTERVFSRTMKPVVGVQQTPGKPTGLSNGVATGLTVADPARRNEALMVSDFRQKVREILGQQ
jgi:hypothetical protein